MSNALINGLPVLATRLQLPRTGIWTGDVAVDVATASRVATGAKATLELAGGAISFNGTVYRSDPYLQVVTLRLVGGANGLGGDVSPRFYNGVPLRIVLEDLLKDAGEQLSGSSSAAAMGTHLAFWAQLQQAAALALSSLADAGPDGSLWRMEPDGSVFFGVDSFQPSGLTDYELLDYRPQENMQVIAAEVPTVYPGESFAGRKVSAVEHSVDAQGSRVRLWFE
jgi:hypothetical protein